MAVPAVAGRTDVEDALADVHRREWGVLLAVAAMAARDFDLAEECVQDAFAAALERWQLEGIPDHPAAWLTTVARRKVVDAVRRRDALRRRLPLLIVDGGGPEPFGDALGDARRPDEPAAVPDERLRLIFTCCHPALAKEAQLALTLRLVCGVATADVAHVLLTTPVAMSARLTRAKRKIAVARIPVKVPGTAELPERLDAVLSVVYLLCTLGHTAPAGDSLTTLDVGDESLRLARVLYQLMPDEPEVRGLLALVLLHHARRATRTDPHGGLLRLEDQNRARWDRPAIAEAAQLLAKTAPGAPGRFDLQARIALEHAKAPAYAATDWDEILRLYDELLAAWPSPVVALNRAVAVSMARGPDVALEVIEQLEDDGRLARYHYLYAVKAELLRQAGRSDEADEPARRAAALAQNAVERAFLEDRDR